MLKVIRTIWSIIRFFITIILVGFIVIVLTQRVSNNKMSIAGIRIFNIITESMVPEYKIGDTLITRWIEPSEIKVGDDVTYIGTEESFKDKIVTHRVIKIEQNEQGIYIFQTKGIANPEPDPLINESQIYGKVVYKLKSITYLNGVIGNLYGMYFAIFLPMGLLFFIEFLINKKIDEEEDREYEEDEDYNKKKSKKKNKRNNKNIEDDYDNDDNDDNYNENEKNKDKEHKKDRKDKMKERRKKRRQKRRKVKENI